jgi:hypothetical protein
MTSEIRVFVKCNERLEQHILKTRKDCDYTEFTLDVHRHLSSTFGCKHGALFYLMPPNSTLGPMSLKIGDRLYHNDVISMHRWL